MEPTLAQCEWSSMMAWHEPEIMPSSRRLEHQVNELFLKSLDGQLSAEEATRFGELIAPNDQACRWLLECSTLEADLRCHFQPNPAPIKRA
jgi:hypothetical protein